MRLRASLLPTDRRTDHRSIDASIENRRSNQTDRMLHVIREQLGGCKRHDSRAQVIRHSHSLSDCRIVMFKFPTPRFIIYSVLVYDME